MKMMIRDSHSGINGVDDIYTMPSNGIDIANEKGERMFSISLEEDRILNIDSGNVCKVGNNILDDRFVIIPIAANRFKLEKLIYKEC